MLQSNKIKKFLLIILGLLAVAIWVHNLNFFGQKNEFYQLRTAPISKLPKRSSSIDSLNYLKPQMNPFKPYDSPKPQSEELTKTGKPVPQPPDKISSRYTIDGIIAGSNRPQAILRKGPQSQVLLTIGDLLEGWKTIVIDKKQVIFSWNKMRDTLKIK